MKKVPRCIRPKTETFKLPKSCCWFQAPTVLRCRSIFSEKASGQLPEQLQNGNLKAGATATVASSGGGGGSASSSTNMCSACNHNTFGHESGWTRASALIASTSCLAFPLQSREQQHPLGKQIPDAPWALEPPSLSAWQPLPLPLPETIVAKVSRDCYDCHSFLPHPTDCHRTSPNLEQLPRTRKARPTNLVTREERTMSEGGRLR